MSFHGETLHGVRKSVGVHRQKVSDFFYFFTISFEFTVHSVGAPKVGAATTFPLIKAIRLLSR